MRNGLGGGIQGVTGTSFMVQDSGFDGLRARILDLDTLFLLLCGTGRCFRLASSSQGIRVSELW